LKEFYIKIVFFFLSILLFATAKAQQIVHIENETLAATEQGFKGNIGLQANFIQNINDIFQTFNTAQLSYVKNKNSIISLTNQNLNIFNGGRIVNDGFQHFRYNRKVSNNFIIEAFTQAQFNEIIKIKFRALNGIGPRLNIIDNDSSQTRLLFGVSYMYEYEEETYINIINRAHRMNSYVSLGFNIGKYAKVDIIAYYQPDFAQWNDFRTSVEATIDFKISERLSFRLQHNLFYDSRPPMEIRKTFYNFRNGLRYQFKK
jgi:hypothetical protein